MKLGPRHRSVGWGNGCKKGCIFHCVRQGVILTFSVVSKFFSFQVLSSAFKSAMRASEISELEYEVSAMVIKFETHQKDLS